MTTRTLRILLVDDHQDTLEVFRQVLHAEGHTVLAAGGFERAWELSQRHPFDLLISDLTLPDGCGWALMERLRECRPGMKGIALTGHGYRKDIERSEQVGYCEHLVKPVDLAKLRAAIERCAPEVEANPASGPLA